MNDYVFQNFRVNKNQSRKFKIFFLCLVLTPTTPYNLTGRREIPIELRNLRRDQKQSTMQSKIDSMPLPQGEASYYYPSSMAENVTSTLHSDKSTQQTSYALVTPHCTNDGQFQQQSTSQQKNRSTFGT